MVANKNSANQETETLELLEVCLMEESLYQGRLIPTLTDDVKNDDVKSLKELTDSITQSGQMTPIVVRPSGTGYEIIDGHRRVLAHKKLGLTHIKAVVTQVSDKEAQVMSVVGNLQRKNLSPIELAMAYRKILDSKYYKDKKALSVAIGKNETYVGDVLNTLSMDSRIVDDLSRNKTIRDLKMLRVIRKAESIDINQKSDKQWGLYQRVIAEGLTREQVKALQTSKKNLGHKAWQTSEKQRVLNIKISTSKLSPEQKEKLNMLINSKLEEIFGVL